jgi:hypothetical protein
MPTFRGTRAGRRGRGTGVVARWYWESGVMSGGSQFSHAVTSSGSTRSVGMSSYLAHAPQGCPIRRLRGRGSNPKVAHPSGPGPLPVATLYQAHRPNVVSQTRFRCRGSNLANFRRRSVFYFFITHYQPRSPRLWSSARSSLAHS